VHAKFISINKKVHKEDEIMKKTYLSAIIILFISLVLFSFPSLALIPGDFNEDGCVEFEDLMIFALAYGTCEGDDNWDLRCDIYSDGCIEFEDLMLFAMHYGECEGDLVENVWAITVISNDTESSNLNVTKNKNIREKGKINNIKGDTTHYHIYVHWSTYNEADGYKVYRKVNEGGYIEVYDGTPPPSSNWPSWEGHGWYDYDVTDGNTYSYYVIAYGSGWQTEPSDVSTRYTWLPPCSLNSPVDGAIINISEPTFSWNPVGLHASDFPYGEITYGNTRLRVWDETADGEQVWWYSTDGMTATSTTYNSNGNAEPLIPGHHYIWQILGHGYNEENHMIASSDSEWNEFIYIGNNIVFDHAMSFVDKFGSSIEYFVSLQWFNIPAAVDYHVFRSISPTSGFSEVNGELEYDDDSQVTFDDHNGVEHGVTYYYYIEADLPAGETITSSTIAIDTWFPVFDLYYPGYDEVITVPNPTFTWENPGITIPYLPSVDLNGGVHFYVWDETIGMDMWEIEIDLTIDSIVYGGEPLQEGHQYIWGIRYEGDNSESGLEVANTCSEGRFYYVGDEFAIISEVNAYTQVENDLAQMSQTLDYLVGTDLIEPFYQLNQDEINRSKGVAKGMVIYWTAYLQESNCGYKVYKSTNGSEFTEVYSQLAPSGYDWYGWWDENVQEGNTYSYFVTAYGDGWESPPSETVTRSAWLPMTYLESPEHEATITDPEINFTWIPTGNQGEFNYPHTILRIFNPNASDPINPVFTFGFEDLTTSSYLFTDTILLDNQIYEWNVISHGCDEEGELAAVSVAGNWGFNYRNMEGEVIIPETTTITDDQTETQLTYVSSDQSSISFSQSTPQLDGLQENDILFIGVTPETPYGLLRKVTQIDRGDRADAPVNLSTEFATLEEAVEELHISENFVFTPADIDYERLELPKGVTLRPSRAGFEETFIWDLNEATDLIGIEGVTVSGELQIDYEMIFNLHLTPFTKYVELRNIVESHTDIEVTVGTTIPLGKDVTLFTIPLGAIPIVPPVVITPFIHVNLGIDGKLEASVTAGLTIDQTGVNCLESGFVYDNGNFYEIENTPNFVFDTSEYPPEVNLSGNLKPYAGPQLEIVLTGFSIAYGNLYGNLELTADIHNDPWWSLYGGFEGIVGAHLKILSWDLLDPIEWPVYEYRHLILDAGGPFIPTIAPPITSNRSAINVTQTSATIRGSIDDGGEDADTLEWAIREIDGGTVTLIDSGTFPVGTYSKNLYDLEPGHTYEFQFNAANSAGWSNNNSWEEFTTDPPTYTITASAGLHGSINPSGDISVEQGSNQSFTINPDTGYQIQDVLVDEDSVGPVSYYTFYNVTEDHSIYATFSEIPEKLLDYITVSPSNHTLVFNDTLRGDIDYQVTAHYTDGTSASISTFNCDISIDNEDALYFNPGLNWIIAICKYENSANVTISYTEGLRTRSTIMSVSVDQYPGSICAKIVDGSGNLVSGENFGYVLFIKEGSSWAYVKEVGGLESIYVFMSLSAGTYKVDFYDYATPLGTIENIYLSSSTDTEVATLVQ